jgi:hypothetical protein
MMSVGPAFAHQNDDCDWDGHHDNGHGWCDDNGDDDGNGGLGFLPGFVQNIIEG